MENNNYSKFNPEKIGIEKLDLNLITEVISYDSKFKYILHEAINKKLSKIYADIIDKEVNEIADLMKIYNIINKD